MILGEMYSWFCGTTYLAASFCKKIDKNKFRSRTELRNFKLETSLRQSKL